MSNRRAPAAPGGRLFHRDAPAAIAEPIVTRAMAIRSATIDADARSVEAVLSTETPSDVYDWQLGHVVREVLRADGAALPDQLPLLAEHTRHDLDAVIGSVRNIRREGDSIVGRVFFAADDPAGDRAWNKVAQGHLTDVSVGYIADRSEDIPAGESRNVGGKTYTAVGDVLRITVAWTPRELSLVAIGADVAAKFRESAADRPLNNREDLTMWRQLLESYGLPRSATDEEARAFHAALVGDRRTMADAMQQRDAAGDPPPADPPAADPPAADPPAGDPPAADPPAAGGGQRTAADLIASGREDERRRAATIRGLARDDIPADLVERAITDGLSVAEASARFLDHHQANRGEPVGSAPAIHSRSRERDATVRTLGAAMCLREGVDPTRAFGRGVGYDFGRQAYTRGAPDRCSEEITRATEGGERYREWSLIDFCREAIRIDGGTVPQSRSEIVQRAAVSGGAMTGIFSTSINAQVLDGYTDAEDSTAGWVREADVPNFQSNERTAIGKTGALTKVARGGAADHGDPSDSQETYKIARYGKQLVIDEQDIIDDRFGVLDGMTPGDLGQAARQVRPNLVYAIILANADLQDAVALFHATHANYGTTSTALASGPLEAGIAAMAAQRIATRPLNIAARFLIVPQQLRFTADVLLESAQRTGTTGGDFNPLKGAGIQRVAEDRMGENGVTDPDTGTAHTGSATNWLLAARPGENGAKTAEVGYLRGSGRAPLVRAFVLDRGQWGWGWDVKLDIGAKALDFRGFYYATGAS